MKPILGFQPDSDPTVQGVLLDCLNIIPTDSGFCGAPTARAGTVAALAAAARGAVVATKLDGTRRIFAGTQTKLYELTGTTWADQTGMLPPAQSAGATATTGGAIAAGTWYYVITALGAAGETLPSNEVAITTTGSTSKNTLTWAAVPGATGYRVYRGVASGVSTAYYLPGNVLTYADTGSAPTAGSRPTASTASGGSYVGSTDSRWSMCQFGDTSIASNLADAMQLSTVGAFAAIVGAPKAKIVVSVSNNFLIAFYTNDGTYGASPDRWWCCAQNNQTDWVPAVATGATTGRLIASEGPITAALPLGDYVVAYKAHALWVGSFVGSANGTWQFTLVPGSDCGAVGQDAVCSIGTAHFIVGEDDFWIFDGTRPVSIGDGVRNWFRANSSQTYRYRTRCIYDRQRNLVWVNYPSRVSTGACDRTLVYHIGRKAWGMADFTGEAFLNFVAPGVTINGLDAYAATIDALPPIPFDSQYWLAGGRALAYFDIAHNLVINDGATAASSLTTCDAGDDDIVSVLDRLRVRFTQAPASASATALYVMNEGDGYTVGQTSPRYDGRFDFHQSGRFHRCRVDMTGDHAETAYDLRTFADGER